MRRRILQSTLLVVTITALVLGVPLAISTWKLVEDFTRADLMARLEQIAARLDGDQTITKSEIELAVPPGGRLELTRAGWSVWAIGGDPGPDPVVESLLLAPRETLTIAEPASLMRTLQLQVMLIVLILVVISVGTGAAVAVVTARRLAEPLRGVADRAARLGAGDFRPAPERHGIPELDRVSDVLDSSAAALADLVQRERALVGDVSHQLRSRLTALALRLDELAAHPDPSARGEAMAALEQVERLSQVLDDLLDSARAARAAGAEPVNLRTGLAAVADEWRPAIEAAGRTLEMRVPDGLVARVTPARIREAVGALVDNALRHGDGTITMSARTMDNSVLIEVRDCGPGIPDELVPHIFDRGVSVGSSTGLGLALARALVEADGGRLELSRPRPPVFTIFLPVARCGDRARVTRPQTGRW